MGEVIFKGEELKRKIESAVKELVDAVGVTLGPMGRNVIINKEQKYYTTKDGVSVANSVYSNDPIEDIVINIIKDISSETNKNAGDGTTTAIILAAAAIRESYDEIRNGESSISIVKELQKAVPIILNYLEENKIDVSSNESLLGVATISANGDKEIGNLVYNALKDSPIDGIVSIEGRIDKKTGYVNTPGYTFDRGTYDLFLEASNDYKIEITNPYLLFIEGKISSIDQIAPILEEVIDNNSNDRNIIVIAEDFTDSVLMLMLKNKEVNDITIIPIKTPGIRSAKKEFLDDMAGFIGNSVFKLDSTAYELKTADRVISSKYSTTIVLKDNNGDKRILEIKELQKQSPNIHERERMDLRISALSNSSSEITIGGLSEIEISEAIDRVEDAVNATKAAMDGGIVSGGGVALKDCSLEVNIPDFIKDVLISPYSTIHINAGKSTEDNVMINTSKGFGYDMSTSDFKLVNMIKANIIDPVKVTKEAVKNAFSVAAMLISTEVLIKDKFNYGVEAQ